MEGWQQNDHREDKEGLFNSGQHCSLQHIFSLGMKIRNGTHLPWGAATLVPSKGLTIPG